MKGLTLHQPWATLVAIGAKRIETRSWRTGYRGLVAIHAGQRRPPYMTLPKLHSRGATRDEQAHWNRRTWTCIDTITDDRYKGPQPTGRRIPKRAQTPTLFWPSEGPFGMGVWDPDTGEGGHTEHLPLGAVVAVVNLVGCVRTEECHDLSGWEPAPAEGWEQVGGTTVIDPEERPLGDYRPGRWAWLLADVHRLAEPIECRGRQGLWEVPGDVKVRILMAQLEDSLAAARAANPEGHR